MLKNFYNVIKTYLGAIASALIVLIVYICWPAILFKNLPEVIIGGICLSVLTNTFQLFKEIDRHNNDTTALIQNNKTIVIEKIDRHNIDTRALIQNNTIIVIEKINFSNYFSSEWFKMIFKEIYETVNFSKGHRLAIVKNTITRSLEDAKSFSGGPFTLDFQYESRRISHMNAAYESASDIIYAVTIDVRNYFNLFWSGINDEYSELNIRAALHNKVTIERIFVMDDDILNHKRTDEKATKFFDIVNELQKGGPKVHLFAIPLSVFKSMTPPVKDTSFFLCDGIIASESGTSKNNDNGHFWFEREQIYTTLLNRFHYLKDKATRL